MAGRIRVFIAASLDGFIAGPEDDLSWLPAGEGPTGHEEGAVDFAAFMSEVGALLMGRRTYDVVCGLGGGWAYGDTPVLVATTRPLEPAVASVRAARGTIEELVAAAREVAAGRDVYVDGGNLIRQALDAELVDELIVTVVPIVLGAGVPLFAGAARRHAYTITGHYRFGGTMLQVHARPSGARTDAAS